MFDYTFVTKLTNDKITEIYCNETDFLKKNDVVLRNIKTLTDAGKKVVYL